MHVDCHQHLWPTALVEALRARRTSPRLDGWTLLVEGAEPYDVRPADHDVDARRAREHHEGKDQVLLSLSSPLGIEHLPYDEARELIDVWHSSAISLGPPFRIWAATPVTGFDLPGLRDILRDDRVAGLQVPATAMYDPSAIERLAPVLRVVEDADRPLLVHPGPPATGPGEHAGTTGAPSWWPALVPYVSQLHASWLAWHAAGRLSHPRLRIVFAALAGLAPLHHERLVARGGEFSAIDPLTFYETSSYGTTAVDATVRVVGVDPIVHGSDRPYAEPRDPGLGDAFSHSHLSTNPQRLLTGAPR